LSPREEAWECFQVHFMAFWAREAWRVSIVPQGNLAVGVSEIRTCPGRGPDKSGNHLWNPAWGLDMSRPWDLTRDKAKRLDISRNGYWNPGQGSDKSGPRHSYWRGAEA
jgi:hypothetical protein